MTIRTGVLSDQHVRMHCSKYLPIPLGKSEAILTDPNRSARPLFGHKLKYTQPPSRPESFDTMAKSIARVTGNPKVVAELEKQYNEELKTAPMPNMVYRRQVLRPIGASLLNVATPTVTSATQTDPNGNGYATPPTNGDSSSDGSDIVQIPPRGRNIRRSEAFQRRGKNATEPRPEYQTQNIVTPDDLNRFAQRALRSTDPSDVLRGARHLSQPGTSASHAGSGQNSISLKEFRQMRKRLIAEVEKGEISREEADDLYRIYLEKLKVDGDDNLQS